MCRTAQARVERTDNSFDAVQCAFAELAVFYVALRGLKDALVHCIVVVSGGDDEVGPGDESVLVDLIVVVECAARRFNLTCAFQTIYAGRCANVLVENLRIGKNLLDLLDAVKRLNQPRMMIEERALHRSRSQLLELGQFDIGLWRSHLT